MKIVKKIWPLVIVCMLMLGGCSEFQEPQIDGDSVEIFVPRDSLRTDIATQLFYWYHVEGAEKYELQVVTPSFEKIDQLVLDTNISGDKFEFTLRPGTYEWSVRAYNHTSSTGYTVHTLFIDSTLDLTNQKVTLLRPVGRDTSNEPEKTFRWESLYNADNYRFELWQPDESGQLLFGTETPEHLLNLSIATEGSLLWRVRALNAHGQTIYSSRELYLDTTRPATPVLTSPSQGQFFTSSPIDFSWQHGPNEGSSYWDIFYLAKDTVFGQVIREVHSTDRSATVDTLSQGIYYWAVRSVDKAGNQGELSNARQFTLE